tara:strand:+ start:545 stop:952 length:408 start_codon:yes stop_codon:yes gene_type:complete
MQTKTSKIKHFRPILINFLTKRYLMIDMNEMMKKAQELSETMKQQQEELAKQVFTVSVGGEMVRMTFNGKQEAKSIEIDPEVVDVDDIETLQDLILSAVNEGLRQSQQKMQNSLGEQIGKMTGGMDFSSLLNPKS